MKRRIVKLAAAVLWLIAPIVAVGQAETSLTIHVVQRGENLYRIALQYGVTVDDLARLNSLTNPSNLQVGQRLLVPVASVGSTNSAPALTHIVQPGETLDTIGAYYGISASELQVLNQLIDGRIYIGQTLIVPARPLENIPQLETIDLPASADEVASAQLPSIVMHTVASGETLFRIAQIYGSTVNAIAAANGIANTDIIYPGQSLLIPNVRPPEITPVLPAPLTSLQVVPLVFSEGQTGMFSFSSSAPVTLGGTFLDAVLNIASEQGGTRQTALLGIPLGTASGIYPATFSITDLSGLTSEVVARVQVVSGGYFQERDIDIIGDSSLLLDPATEDAEMNRLRAVMSAYNPERYFDGVFGLPAAATITSSYGNTRSYNNGAVLRVHLGTDFGGAPGAPILAPASGRVVLAEPLSIRGNATVIDHGWGVYTGYWHQSELYVIVGDMVEAGQVIGAVGATGRVSGPHLHWELWINGTPVDPMQWTVQSFH